MDGVGGKERERDGTKVADNASAEGLPQLRSETLLQGGNEVLIEHGNCTYSLRVTRQGKLILTK